MTEIDYLVILCVGVGIFIGGMGAYFDQTIHEYIGIGIMVVGILVMLMVLLARDFTGFTTPPFQL